MPSETRTITFSNAEVTEALNGFFEASHRPPPPGGAKQLIFSNDREVRVTIEPNEGTGLMHLYEHEVAAALILYCNKRGIRVARRAVKSLQVMQDVVSLHLVLRS